MQQSLRAGLGYTGKALACTFALLLLAPQAMPQLSSESKTVERKKSDRPPLETAADALGMERGVRRELTSINAIYFTAKGTFIDSPASAANPKVIHGLWSMSYYVPAVRSDITRKGADGKPHRDIRVANGTVAWNETEPGVGDAAADTSADERLSQIWLTPQGALRAMVDARAKDPNAVKISKVAATIVFEMTFQAAPLRVELNSDNRPELLKWSHGGKQIEVQYFKYKDWELLDVFFPQRIVQRVDGKVVADLTVTDFRSNPYVVFPIPKSLRKSAS